MTAEVLHLLLMLGVVCAPLPMIFSLLADDLARSTVSPSLTDMGLTLLALCLVTESLVITSLGFGPPQA